MASLKVLEEEKLADNAAKMGEIFREGIKQMPKDVVLGVRGKGLLNAVIINKGKSTPTYQKETQE